MRIVFAFLLCFSTSTHAALRPSAERLELLQPRFDRIRAEAEEQNKLAGGFLSAAGFFGLASGLVMVVANKPNPSAANYLMGAGFLSMLAGTFTLAGASEFERFAYEHDLDRKKAVGGEKERIQLAEERLQDLRSTSRFQRYFTNGLLVAVGAWNIGMYEKQRWGLSAKEDLGSSGLGATSFGLWRTLAERRFQTAAVLATVGLTQLVAYAWDNDPAQGYLLGTGVLWAGWGLSRIWLGNVAEAEGDEYEIERGEEFVSWYCYPTQGGAGLLAQITF